MEILWLGCGAAVGILIALLLLRGKCGEAVLDRLLEVLGKRLKKSLPEQDELTQCFLRLLTDGDKPDEK